MASLVLGIGSSHSIMLMATAEDWPRFVEVDKARASYFDKAGRPTNYEGLLATADKEIEQRLHPDALRALYQNCQANLEKLRETIRRVVPDIIVIIGDDQKEMFLDDNLPAFLVYWGKQIVNRPTARREAWDWYTEARRRYCETEPRAFPVAAGLAEHMVAKLMEASFDVAQSSKQPENVSEGEGHAFAFARQWLMPDKTIPIVPVFINAYYPPNQPSSRRCYEFGRALCRAIESAPEPARVAIIGT